MCAGVASHHGDLQMHLGRSIAVCEGRPACSTRVARGPAPSPSEIADPSEDASEAAGVMNSGCASPERARWAAAGAAASGCMCTCCSAPGGALEPAAWLLLGSAPPAAAAGAAARAPGRARSPGVTPVLLLGSACSSSEPLSLVCRAADTQAQASCCTAHSEPAPMPAPASPAASSATGEASR